MEGKGIGGGTYAWARRRLPMIVRLRERSVISDGCRQRLTGGRRVVDRWCERVILRDEWRVLGVSVKTLEVEVEVEVELALTAGIICRV